MTVTTAQCKQLIVDSIVNNPDLFTQHCHDGIISPEYLDAVVVKNWSRVYKTTAHNCEYDSFFDVFFKRVDEHIIKYVRKFTLIDSKYEGQYSYLVYELKDGSVVLGEFVGD